MHKTSFILSIIFLCLQGLYAQDTFSICAVDPSTGQVGSAGASCIPGSKIISDVHPGIGVVHTQAYYLASNKTYAKELMDAGYSPQEIIDSLLANDAGADPTLRQYGIVDLVDGGRSAAYTGENTDDYKNHITGPTYSIQGNILLGQQILDSMEARFLNTEGTLACKLMAALQGANVPGADTRCLDDGLSSLSAFIRVALSTDDDDYFIDLNVGNSPDVEPIDSLQTLFHAIGGCSAIPSIVQNIENLIQVFPVPAQDVVVLTGVQNVRNILVKNIEGKTYLEYTSTGNTITIDVKHLQPGIYLLQCLGSARILYSGKILIE
jgi:uncharacterized Ntn-hydrolase superfamily protein